MTTIYNNQSISDFLLTTSSSPLYIIATWFIWNILYPILAYFLPVAIFLSVVNNFFVLLIFITRTSVNRHTKSSIRVYYIATAIGDIVCPLPIHIAYFFVLCFVIAETFTHWLSAGIVAERVFALNWPFLARRVASAKKAIALCLGVLLFAILLQVYLMIINNSLTYTPDATAYNGAACHFNNRMVNLGIVYNFTSFGMYTIYPEIAIMILDGILAFSILRIARGRQNMVSADKGGVGGEGASSASRRELNSAIVILALAALPLSIYVPNAVFWCPFFITTFIRLNADLTLLLISFARTTLTLTTIVHFWNIYVYSFRVTGFMNELIRILSCGLYKRNLFTSKASASAPSLSIDKICKACLS